MKKVLTVLLVLLIFGSSAIYTSASDFTHPLSKWYEQLFKKEDRKLQEFTRTELNRISKELSQFSNSSQEIEHSLSETLLLQLKESNTNITDYQEDIGYQLEEAVINLSEADLTGNFNNDSIEAELEADIENILKEVLEGL